MNSTNSPLMNLLFLLNLILLCIKGAYKDIYIVSNRDRERDRDIVKGRDREPVKVQVGVCTLGAYPK